ncbi:hypothetical protein CPC08DRAFT_639060 [Agrocybe pediades]|nr:hypothetical protein CPC08DRAFT_639060 [Agrocybe pediades]
MPYTSEPPHKRPRIEAPSKFTDFQQIRTALRDEDPGKLKETLTSLRNQLAVKAQESSLSPQDERLNLAKQWIESSPGANELFEIWDNSNRQAPVIALVVSLLSSLLSLFTVHYNNHSLGQPIMKALLTPSRLRTLNSYIGGANNELIIVVLKLYNVMSSFAGGRDKKAVLEGFGWEIKSLPKLLNMRRKTHGERDPTDPLLRPDIRTLYILLLLSFVDTDSPSQTKTLFLEQHREAFLAIFKGLIYDHYSLARKILEVCWGGIWSDSKVKRTLKVGLFNETTLGHIIKLYERSNMEDDDEDHIPANLVHHFLLAICTRPGTGICFRDRGWYPRELDPEEASIKEEEDGKKRSGKIYNKILANILKTLKVNEDARQQELVIKILTACPELVAGYWPAVALTLEPRLSSKWIANIAIFGSIISLSIPSSTFFLPNSQFYEPTPPPLSTVIENILPSVNTKSNFSKGLQSTSGLVQHCTAHALSRCLVKFQTVLDHFRKIAMALEEDEEEGQWNKRCKELERDVRRRVPEFQVLVAFSQQKSDPKLPNNPTKTALLAESSQRLLWLYQRCLPSVVAEARFDVGKLLQAFSPESGEATEEEDQPLVKLQRVQKMHILSLLKESDQFTWTGKIATLSHSPFYILVAALTSIAIPALRDALKSVLRTVLSQSILFQEDRDEPDLWLDILPQKPVHVQDSSSVCSDETEGVIAFIDDCVQRCLKTPYRYVEALHALDGSSSTTAESSAQLQMYPSPLIMTVIEQLDAKTKNKSLSASHVLAIVSYVRKLVFNLTTKTTDLNFLRKYADKLYSIVLEDQLPSSTTSLWPAICREFDILRAVLMFSGNPAMQQDDNSSAEEYLTEVETKALPETEEERISEAVEIVHWMRTSAQPLSTAQLGRVAAAVHARADSLVPAVIETLEPGQVDVWQALDLLSSFSNYRSCASFQQICLHTSAEQIVDERYQTVLTEILLAGTSTYLAFSRSVHLILHYINAARNEAKVLNGHICLLARILKASMAILSEQESIKLKEEVFIQTGSLKSLMVSPASTEVLQGLQLLLDCINPTSTNDRVLIAESSSYWLDLLKGGLDSMSPDTISTACIWIKYMQASGLFELLDAMGKKDAASLSPVSSQVAGSVLEALRLIGSVDPSAESLLAEILPLLISLKSAMPDSTLLEDVIAMAVEATLPIGVDSCPPSNPVGEGKDIIRRSETRWTRRLQSSKIDLDLRTFLYQTTISQSIVKIVAGLIYRRSYSRPVLDEWLQSPACLAQEPQYLLPILHAFLDSSDAAESSLPTDTWAPFIPICVKALVSAHATPEARVHARHCLAGLFSLYKADCEKLLKAFSDELQSIPDKKVSVDLVASGAVVANKLGLKAHTAISGIVDKGIQRCIDNCSPDQETDGARRLTDAMTSLLQRAPVAKAHLVETLLTVTIQHRLWSVCALRLAITCLASCNLKPLVVNRHLQSIIQHPHFFRVCASSSSDFLDLRETLIELLYRLFNLHPTNTCQVTHIEPLIKVYRGTLSNADLRILAIFQLFEGQKKLSVAPLLARWSTSSNTAAHTALEALQSLDPVIVLRTCLNFPRWRRLSDQAEVTVDAEGSVLYDPVFLMLLFSHMLADQPPSSAFGWIELYRTNVVSLFIRALSSRDGLIRDLALCQVVGLWKQMETADLQERPHVLYILNLLKDLYPSTIPTNATFSDPEYPRRLPTYTALLLMHSLRAVFNPSNFIYPITARFLLQRPTLDITDVPMLYNLLYSSADESWKKERTWIIKFLADGMVGSEDWRILKRRHTWDLLASLFQSSTSVEDAPLRAAILEVLANLTCNAQATTSLILKSALLPWIEMQILNPGAKSFGVEWMKIFENILVIVDPSKIENSTNGEWQVIICRCLKYLLDKKYCCFPYAVSVILRLSLLPGPPLEDLPSLLDLAVEHLESLENSGHLDSSAASQSILGKYNKNILRKPPHYSLTLHQTTAVDATNAVQLYQNTLEILWRSSMALPRKCDAWDKLTARMLAIRGSNDLSEGGDVVAEWIRVEAIRNMGNNA